MDVEPSHLLGNNTFEILLSACDCLPLWGYIPSNAHDGSNYQSSDSEVGEQKHVLPALTEDVRLTGEGVDDITSQKSHDGNGAPHDHRTDDSNYYQNHLKCSCKSEER